MVMCQSCGMPVEKDEDFGTNADGSKNEEYCVYCFKNGEFTDDIDNVLDYIEEGKKHAAEYAEWSGMTEAQMIEHMETVLPTLKRWQKSSL